MGIRALRAHRLDYLVFRVILSHFTQISSKGSDEGEGESESDGGG